MTSPLGQRWYVPVGAFVALAVGIGGAAALHLRGFHRDLRSHVQVEVATIARLKATEIVEWRNRVVEDAGDLQHPSSAATLSEAVAANPDPAKIRLALHRLKTRLRRNHLRDGAVVDERGTVLLATDGEHDLGDDERAAVAEAFRRGTPAMVDLAGGGGAIAVVVPLPADAGPRRAAVLIGTIRDALPAAVRTWPSAARSAEAYLAAVHGDEVVVLDALRFIGGDPYPPRFRLPGAAFPLALAARGDEGVGPALDHRGARVIAARLRIPESNWVLSVKENEQELLAPALEREHSLGIAVVALLVACGAALAFWWRAVRADVARREREVADQERRQALEARVAFSERLASLGTLAAGIAHEINNPLSYVISNLEYAHCALTRPDHGDAEPEALASALVESRHGARRIAEIVRTLRTFSRRDRGDGTAAPLDLREAVRAATLMASHQIRGRAALDLDLRDVPPVAAPESELAQIVVNLLLNAVQAMPAREADPARAHRIRVVTRTQGQSAVLEVADNGAGIPPETMARIFDPFVTTKPAGEGTGLGLWVCHGIVERLGGRIDVESTVGVGSTFRVRLPPSTARPAA